MWGLLCEAVRRKECSKEYERVWMGARGTV